MSFQQNSKEIIDQTFNEGPWNLQENLKYLVFLDQNKIVMASKQKKKRFRVFDQMSQFVQTRSSLQCRSHHQKAIEKYKQVKVIIAHEKGLIDPKFYRLKAKEMKQQAKVKENYEGLAKVQQIKPNTKPKDEQKEPMKKQFPLLGMQTNPSFYDIIPPQTYQMLPVIPNPLLGNYFYYQFFPQH